MSQLRRKSSKLLRRISSFFERAQLPKPVAKELVPLVRERFLYRYRDDPDLYDEKDIKAIQDDDWTVFRFIEVNKGSQEDALEMLDNAMKWRKSYGVNQRTLEKDCPREFFEIGALFEYNTDKNGNAVLLLRVKCNKKVPELQKYIEQFVVGVVDEIDKRVRGKCAVSAYSSLIILSII